MLGRAVEGGEGGGVCVCGEMACVCVCVRVRLWILPSACDLQNVTHSKRPSKLSSGLIPPPAATTRAAAPSAVSGHCGESRAPAERAGPPAATTRAAAPSAVSGHCAGHCGESRAPSGDNARHSPFWRQPLLQSLECRESRAPSGDHARRSPFCSLWTLRRPLRREPGPQRRQRAPQPLLETAPSAVSGVRRPLRM